MRYFRHIRAKIVLELVAAFLMGSGAAAGWLMTGGIGLGISAVVILLYGIYRAVFLFANDPAVAFDGKGIEVGRLFHVSRFRWSQLREVRVSEWRIDEGISKYLPSWLPLERDYLELQIEGAGASSSLLRLRADMIELPDGGVQQLVALIRAAQVSALGSRGAAMTRLGMEPSAQAAARQQQTGIHAERFARLGLDEEPEPMAEQEPSVATLPERQPFVPARPTFGRKAS